MGELSVQDPNLQKQRVVSKKEFSFLKQELDYWDKSGLIEARQRSDIENLYILSKGRFSQVIVALGAMLIGLGFLSYVAANWLELSRTAKVAVILVSYLGAILAAWKVEPFFPHTSRALLLIGSFVYGGGIFLMAIIFHEGGHYTTALFWWMAGIVPAAVLFKDRFQLLLIQVIFLLYLNGFYQTWLYVERYPLVSSAFLLFLKGLFWPIQPLLLLLAVWGLWLYIDRRCVLGFRGNMLILLNFLGIHFLRYTHDFALLLLFFTVLGIIFCHYPQGYWKENLTGWGIALIGLSGLMLTFPEVWRTSRIFREGILPSFIADIAPAGLAVGAGVAICIALLWFSRKGSILAVTFFCLLVLRFYVDKFYDFMPKALFFTGGGALLIALGVFMERTRRIAKISKLNSERKEEEPKP